MRGYVGCPLVVDHFSKWAAVHPIRDKQGSTVARVFEHQVLPSLPAKPSRLLTDNRLEFVSETFNEVLVRYGISHIYSTPYHPSSNGAVEQLNRTII